MSISNDHLNYPQNKDFKIVSSLSAKNYETRSTKFLKLSKLTLILNYFIQVKS